MDTKTTAGDLATAGEGIVEAVTGKVISGRTRAIVGGVAGAGNGLLEGMAQHVGFDLPGVLSGVLSVLKGATQIVAASRRKKAEEASGPDASPVTTSTASPQAAP
ncbi:hypothetical protein [Parasaccharibacter sp. TMW 2.1884]|uniref:hypothetical protein n=1 Tax=Parasaccharibacter sp. TMW 2.1884 TaxID=2267834 RepID=UPI002011911E|nr:hypothetical protein [Parasaccharibacter sp. TMW 2.1884]